MRNTFDRCVVHGEKEPLSLLSLPDTKCKAVNVRREKMDSEFAALIAEMAPERHYMRLFKENVRQVWKQRQRDSEVILRAAKTKLDELRERKNRLVEFLLDGRLDQEAYDDRCNAWPLKWKQPRWSFQRRT
jgi:hypothetical protein